MPTAEHSATIRASLPRVWAFVRDMDNWAPLVTGYQRHEKLDEADSFWFLKGELGGLTRIAEFKVHIDEWDEAGRVRFSLQGVNEPVTGSGSFDAVALAPEGGAVTEPSAPPPPGLFSRLRDRIVRALFARLFGGGEAKPSAAAPPPMAGDARTEVTFRLTLTAGGMAGMVLNALLAPMMKPVAEDLSTRLAAAIEA